MLPGFNANAYISFTYDIQVDREGLYMNPPKDSSTQTGDIMTGLYKTQVNWVPYAFYLSPRGIHGSNSEHMGIKLDASSFVVRRIVGRKQAFMETWALLGGAWGSAILILAIFFNQKTGGPGGTVQIFRFKGPKAKTQLNKEAMTEMFAAYGSSAVIAVKQAVN